MKPKKWDQVIYNEFFFENPKVLHHNVQYKSPLLRKQPREKGLCQKKQQLTSNILYFFGFYNQDQWRNNPTIFFNILMAY